MTAVDMRQLAALEAIARERSFRGAAQALGYVQSAVSQQIVQLERALGVRLVDRAPGTAAVALTAAGELVLQHAAAVRERYEAAERELATLKRGARPRLRVGVVPGALALMGDVLADAEPVSPGTVGDRVARGDLDVAFCGFPVDDDCRLATCDVLDDPVVGVVAADAWLDRPAQPADLAGRRLVRLTSWAGQDAALRWLGDAAGCGPPHVTDREATLRSLVAAGEGIAIVPRLVALGPGTRAVELHAGPPPRRLGLVWAAERSGVPAIQAFVADVRRTAGSSETLRGAPGDRPITGT
jgi:DNA-binding transcriptional LysR family regulator